MFWLHFLVPEYTSQFLVLVEISNLFDILTFFISYWLIAHVSLSVSNVFLTYFLLDFPLFSLFRGHTLMTSAKNGQSFNIHRPVIPSKSKTVQTEVTPIPHCKYGTFEFQSHYSPLYVFPIFFLKIFFISLQIFVTNKIKTLKLEQL